MLIEANLTFNIPVDSSQTFGPCTARVVKYIAKSAAKNINSEESHTIVPTATMLGRLTLTGLAAYSECAGAVVVIVGLFPILTAKPKREQVPPPPLWVRRITRNLLPFSVDFLA